MSALKCCERLAKVLPFRMITVNDPLQKCFFFSAFFAALHPLCQLTESDINRSRLPSDIGKKWKKLGRELEFKKTTIDAIDNENDSYSERCFDLLVRWLQKEGQQGATAGKLATALTNIGLQILADRLIGMWLILLSKLLTLEIILACDRLSSEATLDLLRSSIYFLSLFARSR